MAETTTKIRQQERIAGLLLMAAAALALVIANSGLSETYHHFLEAKFGPEMPRFGQMSVHYWVADGLMVVFFLLVGLEVKREWYDGRLATPESRRLPMIAAAAGMAVPALTYFVVIGGSPELSRGWAIPAATDIAFALGVLALIGSRVPASIKLLLVTIAIIDDIGAVVIIAIFYTADLNPTAIALSVLLLGVLAGMNMFGVRRLWPYMIATLLLWLAVLASGVHATIAGVLAALTIPLGRGEPYSPLKRLEHLIHPWVMFGIVPIFGFVSAGVEIGGVDALLSPLPLGITAGLLIGKQIGVFGAIWAADRTGIAPKPPHLHWVHIYGASLLCGIGFTMSLFIGALAFTDRELIDAAKIGTLAGSLTAGLAGYAVLMLSKPIPFTDEESDEAEEVFGEDAMKDPTVCNP
jgi:NhaA family Na+:H+ antiporter